MPAAASGSATWSAPVTVARCQPTCYGDALLLATSPRRGSTLAYTQGPEFVARRILRDGTVGPLRTLARRVSADVSGPWISVGPSGATVAVWQSQSDAGGGVRINARRMSPSGKLGRVHKIATTNNFVDASVAVAAGGDATIAWAPIEWMPSSTPDSIPLTNTVLRARRLTAKGSLGPTLVLASGDGEKLRPRVAVGPSGRAKVAWHFLDFFGSCGEGSCFRSSLHATTIRRDSTVSAVHDIATWTTGQYDLVMDARGNATIVWLDPTVKVRRVRAGQAPGPIHLLGSTDVRSGELQPRIAVDRTGNATVVWPLRGGSQSVIQSRRIGVDGKLGPLTMVSVPAHGADEPQIAFDSEANATVVWLGGVPLPNGSGHGIASRSVAPGGKLGAIRTLASGAIGTLSAPKLAADVRGVVTAAWLRRPVDQSRATIEMARLAPRRER